LFLWACPPLPPTLPFYKSLDTATSNQDRPKYKTKQCRLSLGIRSTGGGYFVAMSVAAESKKKNEKKRNKEGFVYIGI